MNTNTGSQSTKMRKLDPLQRIDAKYHEQLMWMSRFASVFNSNLCSWTQFYNYGITPIFRHIEMRKLDLLKRKDAKYHKQLIWTPLFASALMSYLCSLTQSCVLAYCSLIICFTYLCTPQVKYKRFSRPTITGKTRSWFSSAHLLIGLNKEPKSV